MTQYAFTKYGLEVELNTLWEVEGGWEGYIMHGKGYAVLIFIPG
jgi:hypothetical protein